MDELSIEAIGSFRRAFIEGKADYISIDGWSPRWARDDVAQAHKLGLLTVTEAGDEQYTELRYRPTEAFRAALQQDTSHG